MDKQIQFIPSNNPVPLAIGNIVRKRTSITDFILFTDVNACECTYKVEGG